MVVGLTELFTDQEAMVWIACHENADDYLGYLPSFLSLEDERPAREQLDSHYAHGGGWRPFQGFVFNDKAMSIKYPGDPAYMPMAFTVLREEVIIVYPHAWVLILQKDGSHEIARMD